MLARVCRAIQMKSPQTRHRLQGPAHRLHASIDQRKFARVHVENRRFPGDLRQDAAIHILLLLRIRRDHKYGVRRSPDQRNNVCPSDKSCDSTSDRSRVASRDYRHSGRESPSILFSCSSCIRNCSIVAFGQRALIARLFPTFQASDGTIAASSCNPCIMQKGNQTRDHPHDCHNRQLEVAKSALR